MTATRRSRCHSRSTFCCRTIRESRLTRSEVDTALQTVTDAPTKTVLTDLKTLIETAEAQEKRGHYFALVLDTIWWRRCVYFVTLGLALIALAFPVIYALLDWGDKTEKINQITGGTVAYLLRLFKGFIPSFASPWIDASRGARNLPSISSCFSSSVLRSVAFLTAPYPGPRPRRVERSAEGWR